MQCKIALCSGQCFGCSLLPEAQSNSTWKLALSVLLCIEPANLEEKILVSQVFCLTVLKLWFDLATSTWFLGIYPGFPLEFVAFFFQVKVLFQGGNL